MAKIRLTHRSIQSLTAGKWMTDYWDDRLPGFGVRVAKSGRKTFVVRYSAADGRKRRSSLGAYPLLSLADACDKAREVLAAVARGDDPQGQKKAERQAPTGTATVPRSLAWARWAGKMDPALSGGREPA